MIFKKSTNLKIFLIFLVTSLFFTLIVIFYSNDLGGKIKKTILLQENKNIYIDRAKDLNGFPANIFEKIQLEYIIDNLQSAPNSSQRLFFNLENQYSKKVKCPKNVTIIYTKLDNYNYIKLDKKKFIMEVGGRKNDIDNINSCILQTVNFINETIKNNYDKALTIYNLYYKENLIYLNLRYFLNDDQNQKHKLYLENFVNIKKLEKNPVEVIYLDTLNISKESDIKVLFFTLFLIFLIISLVIFYQKKYLNFIKKIF